MSFKREGDDKEWLSVLQKRRISELLTEDIPENEAFLMRNGRFACLVCSYRPVFDTVEMLSIHRNGKKHKTNAEEQRGNYPGAEQEGLPGKYRKTRPFVAAAPYDSRQKKSVHTPRPKLNLESSDNETNSRLRGGREKVSPPENYSTIAEFSKQSHHKSRDQNFQVTPYSSGNKKPARPVDVNKLHATTNSFTPLSSEFRGQYSDVSARVNENSGKTWNSGISSISTVVKNPAVAKTTSKASSATDPPPSVEPPTAEKLKAAEKYFNAIGNGWKKDLSGQWVRDSDAEFDSDEEAPDL